MCRGENFLKSDKDRQFKAWTELFKKIMEEY
jgi:hypothetical protein